MSWPQGFFEIDLDLVTTEEPDPAWRETPHGRTRGEIEGWVEAVKQIQHLARDRGYGRDDFLRLADSRDPKERVLAHTYRHIYEPAHVSAIRVSWDSDQQRYTVANGQHRLAVAKRAGLRHLPAFVSAPDEATLSRLRVEGERIAGDERPHGYTPIWDRRRDAIEDRGPQRAR